MFFPELDTGLIDTFPRLAVKLKNKAFAPLRNGDFRIYEDSVEKISGNGKAGYPANLFDKKQKFAGAGLFDPYSPVRIKVLSNSSSVPKIGRELFAFLAEKAAEARKEGVAASSSGNAFRLVNGESDGFPGLVADRYDTALVMKLYSAAWLPHAGSVAQCLFTAFPGMDLLVIRLSRELAKLPREALYGLSDGMLFSTECPEKARSWDGKMLFRENELLFEADLVRGQKTGFFLDQRDNRKEVGRLAKNAHVLNVFSYSGGFSLYAAKGGAKSVTDVDFSKYAIEESKRNFQRNRNFPGVAACKHDGIVGDAFEVMGALGAKRKKYDIVIIDPPSFAKAGSEVENALRSYTRLARLGCALVRKGGILVFASCSSRVGKSELFPAVNAAISESGYRADIFKVTEHAFDHPAKFPESKYLKCQYARIF
ncbi:MAG: class I SAM-dependent methyltransferase [Lentisphaeria bacterium]|nr:class I SAM-dependent methyltransferase [Lentisphaeria bacterium]